MATVQKQEQSIWQSTTFLESTWISGFTTWLLTFGGKAARIILISCTLYMSAELYPGVSLPASLNIAVLLLLSFALDMGGLGLAQIAKTARKQGNIDGAIEGEKLAKWLIRIMIAGIVTVALEQAAHLIPFDKNWQIGIEVVQFLIEVTLTVARVVCAVNYGHVIHALEHSVKDVEKNEQNYLEELQSSVSSLTAQISALNVQLDTANHRVLDLTAQVQGKDQENTTLRFQIEADNSQMEILRSSLDGKSDQSIVGVLRGQIQEITAQLDQAGKEKIQTTSQLNRSLGQVSDLSARLEIAEKQVSDLTGQLQEMTCEKQEMTSQVNRSQQQVSDLTGQIGQLTSQLQEVTSPTGQMKAVKSKRSQVEEVTQKLAQGTVLQFDEGRRKRNPLEVKAWCDAHPDLTQAEQAEQLGISDAANLRRILRRARELEETGQIDQQVANDL